MVAAISGGQGLLFQTVVFPKNGAGPAGKSALLNTTAIFVDGIELPLQCPNGKHATLGMSRSDCGGLAYGYPPSLYPNLSFTSTSPGDSTVQQAQFGDEIIGPGARPALLLGPFIVNTTLSLVSVTVPVINNTSAADVLGWLSVVMDARLIRQVLTSTEGLGNTGETLLIGPTETSNIFRNGITYATNGDNLPNDFQVEYVFPLNRTWVGRHPDHIMGTKNPPFKATEYPCRLRSNYEIDWAYGQLRRNGERPQRSWKSCGNRICDTRVTVGQLVRGCGTIEERGMATNQSPPRHIAGLRVRYRGLHGDSCLSSRTLRDHTDPRDFEKPRQKQWNLQECLQVVVASAHSSRSWMALTMTLEMPKLKKQSLWRRRRRRDRSISSTAGG